MKKLSKLLKTLDNNLLKIALTIFIIFIPLYPKLPLIDIEYTYIYIRFEDFLVTLIYLIFIIQAIRKKLVINRRFFWLFILFWTSIFISFFMGFFYLKTIPVNYIGLLHTLRRVEYMSIFFVAFASINSSKDFLFYLKTIIFVFLIVSIYGIGQKLFGWPAVQTMNPEYARGYLLFLTPEARISSTFAGHYDLASYLIFLMPMILTYYLWSNKKLYFFVFFTGLLTLIFTASRISYLAYLLTIFPLLIFLKKWRVFILILFLTIILTFANKNLTSRLSRTFQVKQILVDQKTGEVYIPQKISTKELPAGSFYLKLKDQKNVSNKEIEKYKEQLLIAKQKQATLSGETINLATLEANIKPVNTIVSDISFATRLQVEWPRAFKAFLSSPFFGTGASSLTEATDNDYLRWLGEFGLIGTFFFLIILSNIFFTVLNSLKKQKFRIIFLGFLTGFIALMINASYIDVFEASKMAFVFWLVSGYFIGYILKKS